MLPPTAELGYVEFDGGHAVTNKVAGQVRAAAVPQCHLPFFTPVLPKLSDRPLACPLQSILWMLQATLNAVQAG
jgi:hypothetical protein